ncbi:hypothetical protein XdyCFBP7245_04405 [Xanthomonas dyei]|uniref:Uncharacterized protein n=1 Tax=Xanthomonas dyei TaxID=743699 RepID=A0A2S7C9J9_9XANT|nr:hypothetical protein XdyCFBP7245_04405 [Xanthomonas dyei]
MHALAPGICASVGLAGVQEWSRRTEDPHQRMDRPPMSLVSAVEAIACPYALVALLVRRGAHAMA